MPDHCTWFAWKTTFHDANSLCIRADGIRGESCQPFGKSAGAAVPKRNLLDTTLPCNAQMANNMVGYMDNLANAVDVDSGTFMAMNERLAEITATLKSLEELNASFAETISDQRKELRPLLQQLNKTKQSGGGGGGSLHDSRFVP